jgi:endonuclease YncB( thermonuclease family)
MLFDGGIYVFKKFFGDLVDFFAGETSSVNEELIYRGLLKADQEDLKKFEKREQIKKVQEELRKDRAEIWEESESS